METSSPVSLIALLHGPDRPGIVARTAGWIFGRGGNILHADQHRDADSNIFFQRIEWVPAGDNLELEAALFTKLAGEELGMKVQVARSDARPKVAVFVSKIEHCFHDLMLRWRAGELQCEMVLVISNHPDMEQAAHGYGVPFRHIPVDQGNKARAEEKQIAFCRAADVELIVMARYMQVLSDSFIRNCNCPVINIHHSFLPAFAGARPYEQAYKRGVKLIGATAHYATANLDEGPIIQQGVAPVNHRNGVRDLMRKG
ncbi:MAG: formyltetrahydrofolate deformylase, partial [Opitutales bacterium]